RLACLRWRHDEAALALADRGDQVDDPRRQVARVGLQPQPLLRVQRHELGELRTGPRLLRVETVDLVEPDQGVELLPPLALAWLADRALDNVPLAQAVLAHLRERDVHVVGSRQVAGGADERVVVEHVEDAGDRDQHIVLGDHGLGLAAALAAPAVAVAEPVPGAAPAPALGLVVTTAAPILPPSRPATAPAALGPALLRPPAPPAGRPGPGAAGPPRPPAAGGLPPCRCAAAGHRAGRRHLGGPPPAGCRRAARPRAGRRRPGPPRWAWPGRRPWLLPERPS